MNFIHCQDDSIKKDPSECFLDKSIDYHLISQMGPITFGKRVGYFIHVEKICFKYLESLAQFTDLWDIEVSTIIYNCHIKLEYYSIEGLSFYLYHSDNMEMHWWKTFFVGFEEFELT